MTLFIITIIVDCISDNAIYRLTNLITSDSIFRKFRSVRGMANRRYYSIVRTNNYIFYDRILYIIVKHIRR